MIMLLSRFLFFFFNDTATTEIYTLFLHDALPICTVRGSVIMKNRKMRTSGEVTITRQKSDPQTGANRSEEHTSELQSHVNLVCRLLLEKKKNKVEKDTDINSVWLHMRGGHMIKIV